MGPGPFGVGLFIARFDAFHHFPHFNGFEAYCSRTAALKSTAANPPHGSNFSSNETNGRARVAFVERRELRARLAPDQQLPARRPERALPLRRRHGNGGGPCVTPPL